MQKTAFTVHIPRPCSENRDAMTPVDNGRFCAYCQKTVIDFSLLTDAEIIKILGTRKNERICGHFLATQLGRELVDVPQRRSFPIILSKRIAASVLFFQTITSHAWAQTARPGTVNQVATPSDARKSARRVMTGKVMDYTTNERLCGMIVQVRGTEIKTITDKAGSFQLPLPDTFSASKFTLQAHYTEQAGKEPEGTIILDEDVAWDSAGGLKEANLFRYPGEIRKQLLIEENKFPMANGGDLWVSVVTTEEITRKKTFWQRISSPFRKKKKGDE